MSETVVSEAEARESLSELIDLALAGREVRITREGAAVVEIRAAPSEGTTVEKRSPGGRIDLEWLRANRVGDRRRVTEDAGTLLSRMRDEDWR